MCDNPDPMGDLEKAFNGIDPTPTLEEENRKLREANKKLQTSVNQLERNIAELQKNVSLTCEKVLDILRGNESYGHIDDEKVDLKKHYSWKDKL